MAKNNPYQRTSQFPRMNISGLAVQVMNESIVPYFGDKNTLFYVKDDWLFEKMKFKVFTRFFANAA
jgi:hypothetical protein